MRYFQEGTAGNISLSTPPAYGKLIEVFASVNSKLSAANSWFDSPVPDFGVEVAAQTSATKTVAITSPTVAATLSQTYSCKITWPTGDHIRWFFNSGGRVRVSFSASTTGSPATDRSTALVSAIQGIGECYISAYDNTGFTGDDAASNNGDGKGYWTLGTTSRQLGSNTLGAGIYSDSFITVYARVADTTGNGADGGAVGKSIVISWLLSSGFGGTGTATGPGGTPNWATDNIDISCGIAIDIFDQTGSGSTVSKNWSNPSVGTISVGS
jgi:hypothetical protein